MMYMTKANEYRKIRDDPDKWEKEKARVNEHITNKYRNDPEYRTMILERNRQAYHKRMALKRVA